MNEIILDTCPFCNKPPQWMKVFISKGQKPLFELQCMETTCPINPCTELHETPQEAADAWNTRRR